MMSRCNVRLLPILFDTALLILFVMNEWDCFWPRFSSCVSFCAVAKMEGSADVCQRLLQVVLALFVIGSLSAAHSAPIIAAPHITEQHADSSAVKTVQTTLVSGILGSSASQAHWPTSQNSETTCSSWL